MRLSNHAPSKCPRWLTGAAVLSILVSAPAAAQVVVETVSAWDGITAAGEFGSPGVDATGQLFSAPAEYLNSWTYYLKTSPSGLGANTMFTANIGTWNGSGVGSLLWTSEVFAGTGSTTFVPYVFHTGGVSLLTSGQTYIFFLDYLSGDGNLRLGIMRGDTYAGHFFTDNIGTDHLGTWDGGDRWDPVDLTFRAEFDRVPAATVPEPATMTLLATGLMGLAASRRKRTRTKG